MTLYCSAAVQALLPSALPVLASGIPARQERWADMISNDSLPFLTGEPIGIALLRRGGCVPPHLNGTPVDEVPGEGHIQVLESLCTAVLNCSVRAHLPL
jgi:hypothetical protein